jgi:hypothetical protein
LLAYQTYPPPKVVLRFLRALPRLAGFGKASCPDYVTPT